MATLYFPREELQRKDGQLKNKGLITGSEAQERIAAGLAAAEGTAVLGASRIAQLEVELKQAKVADFIITITIYSHKCKIQQRKKTE